MAATDYFIAEGATMLEVVRQMNEKTTANAAWQPYGGVCCFPTDMGGYWYSQLMTLGAPTASLTTDTVDAMTYKLDGVALSPSKWITVDAAASVLDGGGKVTVLAGMTGYVFYPRDIFLIGGGTNFGAGGNRLLDLTDGTTVYMTTPNANLETAPATTLRWGTTAVPFITGTANTPTVEGDDLYLAYSGGTTDHVTGSIHYAVCVDIEPA